jgi:hypothetical protein
MAAQYLSQREKLTALASEAHDMNRIIIAETLGASFKSFRHETAPSLTLCGSSRPVIKIRNIDTYNAGLDLLGPERENHGRVACLNMGSSQEPGGNWLRGFVGQEEMVRLTRRAILMECYSPRLQFSNSCSSCVLGVLFMLR